MLSAVDPLPQRPRRVLVAGVSGSGKTTLARHLSEALDIPYAEMDNLYHGASWTPRDDFVSEVERFSAADAWVCEWQYRSVRQVLAERADTFVWLDLPTPLVMLRVIRRTVRRRLRNEELWNDNREAPLHTFFTDRDHIVRWAWRTRRWNRDIAPDIEQGYPHLAMVHLRRRSDVDRFVARLQRGVA